MNVLITGGAGFIGSHIAEKFIENGHNVIIIDNLSTGDINNISNLDVRFNNMDIRSMKVEDIFKNINIDIVYHEAAQVSVGESIKNPSEDASINIMGLINLLENSVKYKVKKFIFASSAAVYGVPENAISKENDNLSPLSFYGLSKLTSEKYIKLYSDLYGLKYIILRYSNVFGPRQSNLGEAGVVSIFSDIMLNNNEVYIYGDGNQTRDFIYVKDVANANYIVGVEEVSNETFNISTNTQNSINKLFNIMKDKFDYSKNVIYKEERIGDIKDSCLDNSKIIEKTSFKPLYTLDKGIEEYFCYLNKKGE